MSTRVQIDSLFEIASPPSGERDPRLGIDSVKVTGAPQPLVNTLAADADLAGWMVDFEVLQQGVFKAENPDGTTFVVSTENREGQEIVTQADALSFDDSQPPYSLSFEFDPKDPAQSSRKFIAQFNNW